MVQGNPYKLLNKTNQIGYTPVGFQLKFHNKRYGDQFLKSSYKDSVVVCTKLLNHSKQVITFYLQEWDVLCLSYVSFAFMAGTHFIFLLMYLGLKYDILSTLQLH